MTDFSMQRHLKIPSQNTKINSVRGSLSNFKARFFKISRCGGAKYKCSFDRGSALQALFQIFYVHIVLPSVHTGTATVIETNIVNIPANHNMREEQEGTSSTSADRAGNAQKWLRDFIIQNSDATTAREHLARLPTTPITTNLIENLREHIERQAELAELRIQNSQQESKSLRHEHGVWERAGAASLLSALDPDAVRETDGLVQSCSALQLEPNKAALHTHRVKAIVKLTNQLSSTEVQCAQRQVVLSNAQASLRDAANALQQAKSVARFTEQDINRRGEEAVSNQLRKETFIAKAEQYDDATMALEEKVKRTGVSARTTHEGVVADANRLADLEKRLASVNQDLKRFHDLPAVRYHYHNHLGRLLGYPHGGFT